MNRKTVLSIVKSAAKFFFDLEPELTELITLQALARAGKTFDNTLPVVIEAYRCQKQRLTTLIRKEALHEDYRLAA